MPPNFDEYQKARTDKPPARLYKYRNLDQTREILRDGTTWWSPPTRFEDLQDCRWYPYEPLFNEDAVQKVSGITVRRMQGERMDWKTFDPEWRQIWGENRLKYQQMTPEVRKQSIETLPAFFRENFVEQSARYKRKFDGIIERLRVFCLCEEQNSPAMWRAYTGDEQRGCVLGFDTEILQREWKTPVHQVQYGVSTPLLVDVEGFHRSLLGEIATRLDNEMEELGRRWPLYKQQKYDYEREWRFVAVNDPKNPKQAEPIPFPPHALVEMGFGAGCTDAEVEAIQQAARELRKRKGGNAYRSSGWTH